MSPTFAFIIFASAVAVAKADEGHGGSGLITSGGLGLNGGYLGGFGGGLQLQPNYYSGASGLGLSGLTGVGLGSPLGYHHQYQSGGALGGYGHGLVLGAYPGLALNGGYGALNGYGSYSPYYGGGLIGSSGGLIAGGNGLYAGSGLLAGNGLVTGNGFLGGNGLLSLPTSRGVVPTYYKK